MKTLLKIRKPVHSKCYGIEIECLVGFTEYDIVTKNPFQQFWYAGYDGSITLGTYLGEKKGVEFVSQPLPYKASIKQINWLAKRFEWRVNDSCGIHVHVSRAALSLKRIQTLAQGIERLSDEQFEELFGREPNGYCRKTFYPSVRYSCINFTNKHTIEFRMFRSGDAAWAIECLRRVKLMCSYKGKVTYEKLMELFTQPEMSN